LRQLDAVRPPLAGRWMLFTFPDNRLRFDMPPDALVPPHTTYSFCAAIHAGHVLRTLYIFITSLVSVFSAVSEIGLFYIVSRRVVQPFSYIFLDRMK
jgi:hypothetical protein